MDSEDEAFNSVMWRYRDCIKNSKSMFAQSYCSHKQLFKKTALEQIQFCKEETGEDWNDIEDPYKYGIFIKKENYEKEVDITMTGKMSEMREKIKNTPRTVIRSRIISLTKSAFDYSKENVNFVMRKIK